MTEQSQAPKAGPGVSRVRSWFDLPRDDAGRSITSRVLSGTGWLMGWRMISRLLGFVSILVLARLLTPSDFGLVALASAVGASIESLSQLGVRDALVRLKDERRDLYDTAFTFQVVRGCLTGLLLVAMSLFADDWFGEPRLRGILLVMAALAVVAGCENIGVVAFSRDLNFRSQFIMQAAPRLLGFVVTTSLAFALRDYRALIAGMLVTRVLGVAMTYVASPHRPGFGLSGWRYLVSFSFWTWAAGLASVIWGRSDPFLLGPVVGSALLGLYMLAGEIALMPVTELLEPAAAALFPGFAMAKRSGSEPVAMALSVAGALALGTIPFSIGVSACSGFLVSGLLGEQWAAAQPLIAVLAWLCIFSPFSYVAGSVLSVQGQLSRVFAANALAAALKVTAMLLVRQTHDLVLIAATMVAVVAAECSIFLFQLRAAGREEFRRLRATMLRALVSTVATAAALFLLPGTWRYEPMDRLAALAAGAAIGSAAFVIFAGCQTALWIACGRRDGAEARLSDVAVKAFSAAASHARMAAPVRKGG